MYFSRSSENNEKRVPLCLFYFPLAHTKETRFVRRRRPWLSLALGVPFLMIITYIFSTLLFWAPHRPLEKVLFACVLFCFPFPKKKMIYIPRIAFHSHPSEPGHHKGLHRATGVPSIANFFFCWPSQHIDRLTELLTTGV